MAVSATSLNNLIPNKANWQNLQTKPIRVPVNLVSRVLDMVNSWVNDLRISVGDESPESEQVWVNRTLGFPDDYQLGDPLPVSVVAEIEKAKAATQIEAQVEEPHGQVLTAEVPAGEQVANSVNAAISAIDGAIGTADRLLNILDSQEEPPPCTQEWIDFMQDPKNTTCWTWPVYLRMLKQEAKEGHQSARDELALFEANGVSTTLQVDPQLSDRQRAKLERRKAREQKRAEKQPELAKHAGSQQQRGVRQVDRVDNFTQDQIERYNRIIVEYQANRQSAISNADRFLRNLTALGKHAEIKRLKIHYEKILFSFEAPPIAAFYEQGYSDWFPRFHKENRDRVEAFFQGTDEQQKESHLDHQFYRLMIEVIDAWPLAVYLIEYEDSEKPLIQETS